MPDDDDVKPPKKSATETLAELVAQRQAKAKDGGAGRPGRRQSERDAAAQSASKSKPALRK